MRSRYYTTRVQAGRLLAAGALALISVPSQSDEGGLQVHGGITTIYQQEMDSGADDFSASGDLILTLPTRRGNWVLYLEGATGTDADSIFGIYPEINADAGSVLDRNGGGHIQVSELYYQFTIGEHSVLMVGQIDTSAHIDRSRIANDENTQFLGTSFVNNPTIQFPDYTTGAMYRRLASERSPELTFMISASDGITDNPSRSYRELVDITGAGKGVFAAAAARWFFGVSEFGSGIWVRTDDHPYLDDTTRNSENYGAYAVYGTAFGAHAFNVRAGVANQSVSPVARFASITYKLNQDYGTFGVGFARILESSRTRTPTSGDTNHAEAWYRLPLVADALHVTADLQYVSNPGFDHSGVTAEAHALIAGLRLDYAF